MHSSWDDFTRITSITKGKIYPQKTIRIKISKLKIIPVLNTGDNSTINTTSWLFAISELFKQTTLQLIKRIPLQNCYYQTKPGKDLFFLNPCAAGGYFGHYKMRQKSCKKTDTLVYGYSSECSMRAIQWIPTWQGLDDFQRF